ncbi:fluoride efflux transporter FluC [Fictibacillus iocasae]|uniref:Fluoride-specific ion channel FluC n=1 Tax=Fictibacillus iocasae TaxID=2715437 RepID=A0ABW2NRL0_9BACL
MLRLKGKAKATGLSFFEASMKVLYIAMAAMAGSWLRYELGMYIVHPYATLLVNLSGCFLIGLFVAGLKKRIRDESVAAAVQTGFIGSFTTFSAFSLDAVHFAGNGDFFPFISYVAVSVIGGILLCLLGMKVAPFVLKGDRIGDE